jgi:hypothetical protein
MTYNGKVWSVAVLGAIALIGGGAAVAQAGPVGVVVGGGAEPEHHTISADYNPVASAALGSGKFVYNLWISGGAEVRDLAGADDNAYVTIFDFAGLVGTPLFMPEADLTSAGFAATISVSNLGRAPLGVTPAFDRADVPNITVDFLNPSASAIFGSPDDRSLGQLVLESRFTGTVELTENVASFDYRVGRDQILRTNKSLTDTTVPQAVAVPLPAGVLGGMGMVSLVMGYQSRRRRGR